MSALKPWRIWIGTRRIRDFADSTEPTRYPDLYTEFIERAAFDELVKTLRHIAERPGPVASDPQAALDYRRDIARAAVERYIAPDINRDQERK